MKRSLLLVGALIFLGCGSKEPQMSSNVHELAQSDGLTEVAGFDTTPLKPIKVIKHITVTEVIEDKDSDKDGVIDLKDKCPNTPEGLQVNPQGCPVLDTLHIIFDSGSAKIKKVYYPRIKKVAEILKANPSLKIEIDGYTDDRGSKNYNLVLSKRRADAVKEVLVKKFHIKADRIVTKGYGEEYPLVPNTTETNRAINRRVEIVALNKLPERKTNDLPVVKPKKVKPVIVNKTVPEIVNDSDFDGIPDSIDMCPNTKSENVNQVGCPIIFSFQISPDKEPTLDNVRSAYEKYIKRIAEYMKQHPDAKIEIDAFTDNRGTQKYRLSFSQKVANNIKKILVEDYGITQSRIVAKGLADAFPLVPNTTLQNKLKNFRVEVIQIGKVKSSSRKQLKPTKQVKSGTTLRPKKILKNVLNTLVR